MADINETEATLEETFDTSQYAEKIFFSSPLIFEEDEFTESEDFQSGVNKAMGVCGIYSTLVSNGIATDDAVNLIISMLNVEMNIKIAELNKEAQINSPQQYIVG